MAVKGKKAYLFYLEQENVEFLQNHFVTRKGAGGLSGFIDKYLERSVWMIKNNPDIYEKVKPGKMTFKSFWQILKLQYRMSEEQAYCEIEEEMSTSHEK